MKRSGFTLIEMLVAISLVALTSFAIYQNFDSGVRVMRVMSRPISEEDIDLFFEKFAQDLQNSFRYKGIPFVGKKDKVSFMTTVPTLESLGGGEGIGRVTYSYDSSRASVARLRENMSQIYKEKPGKPLNLLSSVESLSFKYYQYNPTDQKHEWVDEREETAEKIPLAVQLQMEIHDQEKIRTFSRTVAIPIGE